VRRRVQQLIAPLAAAAALEPKRVTLKADRQPLSAVLREIEKQTGYPISAPGAKDGQRYRFEMRDVPFWEAVDRVGAEARRAVSVQPLETGILLNRREGRPPFVTTSGPFRIELTRFHEDRDIDFAEPGQGKEPGRRDHLLTLTASVLAEPRFILLAVGPARVEVAVDEDNKSLGSPPPAEGRKSSVSEVEDVFREDFQHVAAVRLQRSSAKARTIRVLRGTIPVLVVVERKQVVVTEQFLASEGTAFRIGGDSLKITQAMRIVNGDFYLRLAVPPRQNGVRWLWHERVHLEDARGNRYETCDRGTSISGGQHEIQLNYAKAKDPKVGPPSKLIVEDWVTLHHPIPFEFKNIPLP
jgi:hypothetical protein